MSKDSENRNSGPSVLPWLVVLGVAAGFLVGRWSGPFEGGGTDETAPAGEHKAAEGEHKAHAPGAAGRVYTSEAQFPPNWVKAAALAEVKGVNIAGLTDAQKAAATQALNERQCTCGCGMESVAVCARDDKACPKSPDLAARAFDLVRAGKGYKDVLAILGDKPRKEGGGAAARPAEPPASARKVAIPATAPRKGPAAAKVTIVEFSDFQCPFCSRVVPTLKQIEETYGKDVAIVFVNQPLPFHPMAKGAAQAFLAAHRQGKAWAMHDKMFANQQALGPADLEKTAGEIGLDVAKFKKDFADPAIAKIVESDLALAAAVGTGGTPGFFINGRELGGAQPFPAFKAIIDEELKKANDLLAKGTKLEDLYEKISADNVAHAPKAAAPAAEPEKYDVKVGGAPVKGPANAPVTIVAFSDFQCPFCSRVVPTLKQIEDEYKGKVRIAFRHFPLDFHQNAKIAAEASMAANEQGKFWEMHDKMFANQQKLDRLSLEGYAQEIGLNMAKFRAALDSGKFRAQVEEDARYGGTVGTTGTPTLYVNGKKLVGAQPFAAFKTEIDAALH